MFNALVKKLSNTNKPARSSSASTGTTGSSRPRSCHHKDGAWVCTLADGRSLTVSDMPNGQSLIKQLRQASTGNKGIRDAVLRYPRSGTGQCILHVTYADGRTMIVRGRCGQGRQAMTMANRSTNPTAAIGSTTVRAPRAPSSPPPSSTPPSTPPSGSGQIADLGPRCCFDPELMMIVCLLETNPYHGRQVIEILSINDQTGMAEVRLAPLMINGAPTPDVVRALVCTAGDQPSIPPSEPTPSIPPQTAADDCCYDAVLNKLLCKNASSPLNGADVTLESISGDLATVYIGGNPSSGMRVPVCSSVPCCLDLATSTLICEDANSPFNGLKVSVEQVGPSNARVAHPSLLPLGFAYVALCVTPPQEMGPDCCFDQDTMTLVCSDPNNPLNGQIVGIVTEFTYPNGALGASVSWPGGAGRFPLCGRRPPEQCPPSYCCVNVDSMTFVCPGSDLNGQPANVASIDEVDGYTYAVLVDGTMVPVCGATCPPPELCPDGLWRTPTGECAMPPECPDPGTCPTCPPGFLLDTATGQCIQMPTCPPCPPNQIPPQRPPESSGDCCPTSWWKLAGHCCESCALDKPCEGSCNCDHDHGAKPSSPRAAVASWLASR
jgi:hypothetical protein